jgi:hypothetical protein
MASSSSRLEELIDYNADVTLEFDDGNLAANSTLLGLYSSVLRGAVEVGTAAAGGAGTSSSGSTQNKSAGTRIPMAGTKKKDCLLLSGFLYPVLPPASISSWTQLETLLTLAASYDIPLVLHKAEQYLLDRSSELDADPKSEKSAWKWLMLADKSGLQDCLSVLAAKAAEVDCQGCAAMERLDGLSAPVLKQLLVVCAGQAGAPRVGEKRPMDCCQWSCYSKTHTLKWVCCHCNSTRT